MFDLNMNTKNYTTPEQRDSLQSGGIEHFKGRAFEEADVLIAEQIRLGNLSPEHKNRASYKQLKKLDELELVYEPMISKEEASGLISRYEPATDRQKEFLASIGVSFESDITKSDATDLIETSGEIKPMTANQTEMIARLGGYVDRSMTIGQASRFIDHLMETQERCNRCGGDFDYRDNRCGCGAFLPKRRPVFPDAYRDRIPFLEQVLRFFGFI